MTYRVKIFLLLLLGFPCFFGHSRFAIGVNGISMLDNFGGGGCAAVSSNDSGDSDLQFEIGSPVTIPAPIAKAIEGIDASSIGFSESGAQSLHKLFKANDLKASGRAAGTVLGNITGSPRDNSACTTLNVAVAIDAAFTDLLSFNSSCRFTFPFPDTYVGKAIAFSTTSAASLDDIATVSQPVVVTVRAAPADAGFPGNYVVTIQTTNTSAGVSGSTEAALADKGLGFSDDGNIYFSATKSAEGAMVGRIDSLGGLPNEFFADATSLLDGLTSDTGDAGDILLGINAQSQALVSVSSSGLETNLVTTNLPQEGSFDVHATGLAVAYKSDDGTNLSVKIAAGEDISNTLGTITADSSIDDISFGWLDTTRLVVFEQASSGATEGKIYDTTNILFRTSAEASGPLAAFSSASLMSEPTGISTASGEFYYLCDDAALDVTRLCAGDPDSPNDAAASYVSSSLFASGLTLTGTGLSLQGDLVTLNGSKSNTSIVGFYDAGDDALSFQGLGTQLAASPSRNTYFGYLSPASTGDLQISVMNFTPAAPAPALSLSPSAVTLSDGMYHGFKASGGIPPYQCSLVSGSGTMDEEFCIYLASPTAGTETVRVTDSAGSTAESTVTVVSPSALDSSYSEDGIAPTTFADHAFTLYGMAKQPSGKILVGGAPNVGGSTFLIQRYLTNGTLDTSFGTSGTATVNVSQVLDGDMRMAVDGNGAIALLGAVDTTPATLVIAKLKIGGSLDTAFSGDGIATVVFSDYSTAGAASVLFQSDGKLLAVGTVTEGASSPALARLKEDGSLDSTFGTGGRVVSTGVGNYASRAATLASDGKIVVVANASGSTGIAVIRYDSSGNLDATFNETGAVTTNFGTMVNNNVTDVKIQPDGNIVVLGDVRFPSAPADRIVLLRYLSSGALDTAGFGSGTGQVTVSLGAEGTYASKMALQLDDKIVVSGNYGSGVAFDLALLRLESDGTLDADFSSDGSLTVNLGGLDASLGVLVQDDGKIAVGGSVDVSPFVELLRYFP